MLKLALERILSTLIPVCSIVAQSSIVSKFTEIDSRINQIGDKKEDLAEVVSLVKSKILDLAIRGKLVAQDPNDESASVMDLYDRKITGNPYDNACIESFYNRKRRHSALDYKTPQQVEDEALAA